MTTFEGDVFKGNVVSSYIPIRRGVDGIEGVFEVYADVNSQFLRIGKLQTQITIFLVPLFVALYAVLFLIVKRADGVLKRQYEDPGRHFDPELVRLFNEVLPDILEIRERYAVTD